MTAFVLLLRRFILRDLIKNKVRSILTVAGIALGVAVMLAINLANQTALSKFRESVDIVSGKTTLVVQAAADSDFDEQALALLSPLWKQGIKFTPFIDQLAVSANPSHEVIQVIGIDLLADREFRGLKVAAQRADEPQFDVFRKNHAYAGADLAQRYNLKPGDSFDLLVNDRQTRITVSGILDTSGIGRAFSGNVLVMDVGCAQQLFSMTGRINRIDMIVPEEKIAGLSKQLSAQLPVGMRVDRPQRRGQQVEKMLRSFQYNLTALSLIALLVGMFLIYNTMSISVIRRRWEIGTLRAIGLSSRLVFLLFTIEAAILGALGSAAGIGIGVGFAQYAVKAVSRTVQSLYADQPVSGVIVEPLTLLIAFVAGTAVTVAAAIAPALEAVSIAPAEATRRASYERKVQRIAPRLALIGLFLLVCGGISSVQPALYGFPFFGYLAAICAVFGTAALTPLVLDFVLKNAARPLSLLGMEARLAALNLHGALGRTSVTIASLMVGISMMVSLAVMIGSFRNTVMTWVQQTLKADLWIASSSHQASHRTGRITQQVEQAIRGIPGIDAVDGFVDLKIEYHGEPCNLGAGELDVMRSHGNLLFLNGEASSKVLARVDGHDAVIVSESFSLRHSKKVGDSIELEAPRGKFSAKIEGVYYDYASDSGYIVLPRESFKKHYDDRLSTTLAVFLKKDADPEKVRQAIFAALPEDARMNIRTNRELKTEVLRVFDNTFSITYALHAISIAVAILGVMNALFALTMEARRDLGIIKYLGASDAQMKRLVLVQAGILGTLGNCGGLVVGFILSFLLIHVINKQSFGWTVQLQLPLDFLLESFALIFVCSLASGLIPASLAARTPAPEVVRSE